MGQNIKTKQGKQTNACKARAVDMERLFQFQQGHTLALFKSQQFNFYWHEKSCVNMETDFLALHTAPIQDESKGSKSDRSSPCISPWTLGRVSIQCLSFVLEAFAFLFQATESYTYLPII